jgi:hypothetical protein
LEGRSSQDMSRVSTRARGTVGGEVSSVGAAVVVDPPQVHILQLRRMGSFAALLGRQAEVGRRGAGRLDV